MTFFIPQKNKKILNLAIATLTSCVMLGVIVLIVLYNQVIELEQDTTSANEEIQRTEEAIAGLKEQKIMVFEGDYMKKVVYEKGLLVDRSPVYLKLDEAWEFASRY